MSTPAEDLIGAQGIVDELRAELETTANVIRVLSAEKEAAVNSNIDAHRHLKEALLDLLAANEERAVLRAQVPGPDQVVIPRADYERLVKALPATRPSLSLVEKPAGASTPQLQCWVRIINRSTGLQSFCVLDKGHEGMHLDER